VFMSLGVEVKHGVPNVKLLKSAVYESGDAVSSSISDRSIVSSATITGWRTPCCNSFALRQVAWTASDGFVGAGGHSEDDTDDTDDERDERDESDDSEDASDTIDSGEDDTEQVVARDERRAPHQEFSWYGGEIKFRG